MRSFGRVSLLLGLGFCFGLGIAENSALAITYTSYPVKLNVTSYPYTRYVSYPNYASYPITSTSKGHIQTAVPGGSVGIKILNIGTQLVAATTTITTAPSPSVVATDTNNIQVCKGSYAYAAWKGAPNKLFLFGSQTGMNISGSPFPLNFSTSGATVLQTATDPRCVAGSKGIAISNNANGPVIFDMNSGIATNQVTIPVSTFAGESGSLNKSVAAATYSTGAYSVGVRYYVLRGSTLYRFELSGTSVTNLSSVSIGSTATKVAVDSPHQLVYVYSNSLPATLKIYDAATLTPLQSISLGNGEVLKSDLFGSKNKLAEDLYFVTYNSSQLKTRLWRIDMSKIAYDKSSSTWSVTSNVVELGAGSTIVGRQVYGPSSLLHQPPGTRDYLYVHRRISSADNRLVRLSVWNLGNPLNEIALGAALPVGMDFQP